MNWLSIGVISFLLLCTPSLRGQEPAPGHGSDIADRTSTQETITGIKPPMVVTLNGQTFHQAEAASSGAKTFTYLPEGATTEDWSEMVTHQILTLQQASGSDEVVHFIRERSKSDLRVEAVLETHKATVFVSLSPGGNGNETQMAVGFAFLDLVDPLQVHFVQYVLKPNRLSQADVEQKLKSWRDLFKHRATALGNP